MYNFSTRMLTGGYIIMVVPKTCGPSFTGLVSNTRHYSVKPLFSSGPRAIGNHDMTNPVYMDSPECDVYTATEKDFESGMSLVG